MYDERARTVDPGEVYERTRRHLIDLVGPATPDQLRTVVAASPAWTVHDVVAHVVLLCSDLNALRFPGGDDGGGNEWTAGQVARGGERTIGDLVEEWDREAPTFADGLRAFGYDFGAHFVADLHAHGQDVRQALAAPADRDPVTVDVALDHYLGFVGETLTHAGWGELEVVTDTETRRFGTGGPRRAGVAATSFELLRAFSARRSRRQVLALDWTGDAAGVLDVLEAGFQGNYALRADDLVD